MKSSTGSPRTESISQRLGHPFSVVGFSPSFSRKRPALCQTTLSPTYPWTSQGARFTISIS